MESAFTAMVIRVRLATRCHPFSERLGLEQRCLRGQPQQRDTADVARQGFPDHQHLADLLANDLMR